MCYDEGMHRNTETERRRRLPAGAAVLRHGVSLAIQRGTLKERARAGYRGMSTESVAPRAGVGKAALTGTLKRDIELFLTATLKWFADPLNSRTFLDLAETQRDPKLKALLYPGLRERRLAAAEKILQRGITRRDLPGDVDVQLALDLMEAPLFWRAVVTQGDTSGPYIRTMTGALLRAIDAMPGHTAGRASHARRSQCLKFGRQAMNGAYAFGGGEAI